MKSKQILTLVLVTKNDKILLGLKKRGHGMGFWNGFGGKVEEGETIISAAKRELYEESKLVSNSLKQIAILTFDFDDKPFLMEVHVFTTEEYSGEPQESEEMIPKWYPMKDLPYDQMWTDVSIWFPLFIKGSKFVGHFRVRNKSKIDKFLLKEITEESVIKPIDCLTTDT